MRDILRKRSPAPPYAQSGTGDDSKTQTGNTTDLAGPLDTTARRNVPDLASQRNIGGLMNTTYEGTSPLSATDGDENTKRKITRIVRDDVNNPREHEVEYPMRDLPRDIFTRSDASNKEELIQEAIVKAKEIIQEAGHLGILENKDDLMGEEVKVKKPKKNPSEEPVPKTSNIEGKENKTNDGTLKKSSWFSTGEARQV